MERLFVDTSAWFALVNAKDPMHDAVEALLRAFDGRLTTSNYVVDETVTLCRYRLGHAAAVRVGQTLFDDELLDLMRVSPEDERRAWELFVRRRDQSYSFTDCTSFTLLRRLGLKSVAAIDDDFRAEGFSVSPTR